MINNEVNNNEVNNNEVNNIIFYNNEDFNLKDDLNNEKILMKINSGANKMTKELSFKDSINLNNVSYKYPDTSREILTNISFSIKKNEYIGIVGKSGSGKSTLLDLIMGLIPPANPITS